MNQMTTPLQHALQTVEHLKTQLRSVLKQHMEKNELTLRHLAEAIGSTPARINRMLMPHAQHEVSLQAYMTAIATLGMNVTMTTNAAGGASITITPPSKKIRPQSLLSKPHPDAAQKSDLAQGVKVLLLETGVDPNTAPASATVATVGRIYIDVVAELAGAEATIKIDGRTMLGRHDGKQYMLLLPEHMKPAPVETTAADSPNSATPNQEPQEPQEPEQATTAGDHTEVAPAETAGSDRTVDSLEPGSTATDHAAANDTTVAEQTAA